VGFSYLGRLATPLEAELDDVHFAAVAALAVEELAAFLGAHPGAETDLADAFLVADFVWIMHVSNLIFFWAARVHFTVTITAL
jgi:hypothetical protein